jgi:RHS repeat-associated protein
VTSARLVASVVLALSLASRASGLCGPGAELAAEAPDVVLSGAIRAEAARLGFDAVGIYEFVRNEFEFQPYYGLMRGPEATLRARRGNEYDLSALLVSLLRVSEDTDGNCSLSSAEDLDDDGVLDGGTRARFVRGRMRIPHQDAVAWVRTGDAQAAVEFLKESEPDSWDTAPPIGVSRDATHLERLHIWVEAEVPLARYRGSGLGGSGLAWISLDPSFKRKVLRPGITLPIGSPELTFDLDEYLSEVQQETPLEVFERQLTAHLAEHEQGAALADVPIDGPIVREAPGVLPSALPYAPAPTPVPQRNASLIPLHTAQAQGGSSPDPRAGALGAEDYRWRLELQRCDPCSTQQPSYTRMISYPEIGSSRILLSHPPVTPTATGYTSCNGQVTRPTLSIGSTTEVFGANETLCEEYDLRLRTHPPLSLPGWGDALDIQYRITASGHYAIQADTGSWSAAKVRELASDLTAARDDHPLHLDAAGEPYVERNGQPGQQSEDPDYLADFVAQDALTGGLLHLAGAHFMRSARAGQRRTYDLHHQLGQHLPWIGLVEARPVVAVLLDTPFMLRPRTLMIDVQGVFTTLHDQATGEFVEGFPHALLLSAHELSAREHVTWEELTDFEAISTIKGLQVRSEQSDADPGGELLTVTPTSVQGIAHTECTNVLDFQTMPDCDTSAPLWVPMNLTINSSAGRESLICDGLDATTYCRIKKDVLLGNAALSGSSPPVQSSFLVCSSFFGGDLCCEDPVVHTPRTPYWRAWYWDNQPGFCETDPAPPQVAASEMRIAKESMFQYQSWNGPVFFDYGTVISGPGVPGPRYLRSAIVPVGLPGAGGAWLNYALDRYNFALLDPITGDSHSMQESFPLLDYFNFAVESGFTAADNLDLFVSERTNVVAGDPVSVFTGGYQQRDVDLSIPGRGGHALQLVRSYSSRLPYDGPLGYGWMHTFDQHLRIEPFGTYKVMWVTEGGGERPFRQLTPTTFEPPEWSHDTLSRSSASGPYEIITKTGTRYRFHPPLAPDTSRARLDAIVDRNGNAITCEYADAQNPTRLTGVIDTAGRRLAFAYVANRLGTITDWTGRTWEYRVDAAGDLEEFRNPVQFAGGKSGVRFEYYKGLPTERLNHNIRRIIQPEDRDGVVGGDVTMEFVYHANDTVQSHVNSLGETMHFAYDLFQRRTTVTNPDGTEEAYIFDAEGNVIRHQTARGVVREYEFESGSHDRTGETDGLGFRTTAAYDDRGNLIERVDRIESENQNPKKEAWTYNEFSQPLSYVDRRGARREWSYDERGNLLEERAFVNGSMRVLRRHQYDDFGNPTKSSALLEEDGSRPRTTRFFYAANGVDVIRSVDANVHEIRFGVDDLSRIVSVETTRSLPHTDAKESIVASTEYDALSRPVETTDAAGAVRRTVFDANGNVEAAFTFVPDPSAPGAAPPATVVACLATPGCRVDVRSAFDAADRLVSQTNALGETSQTEYDVRGRPILVRSPLGHETRLEYDADGNRLRTIDPTGAESSAVYDAEDRVIETRDALGRRTSTTYDREGRVLTVTAPGDVTVAEVLEYDAEGNPLRAENALGVESQAAFDELGRRTRLREAVGDPLEAETRFAYDLEGRLVEKTDPLGRKTLVHYDVLGRLSEVRSPLGHATRFSYDEIGNRTRVETPTGEKIHFEHDARGLVTRRYSSGGDPTLAIDDTYGYDGVGRMTMARTASGITRFFAYDALDRAVSMHDPAIGTVRQVFDADGRVVQIGYPDGRSVHYGYSARGEVTSVRDPAIASLTTPLGDWQLAYDPLGRPVRERDPFGVERRTTYTEHGFVDRVELHSATALVESYAYSGYDALGNPGQIVSTDANGPATTSVQYDARSRIEKVAYPGGSLAACLTACERFQYDQAGNRTLHVENGISRQYVVDADDRLLEIRDAQGATLAGFTHDAAGRRTGRSDTSSTYAYDALGRLRTFQLGTASGTLDYTATDERTLRTDAGGTTRYLGEWFETIGTTTRRLVHGPGVDNVLGQVLGTNQVRTLLRDGTANVVRTALDGGVSGARRWEAFGGPRGGPLAVERGFHGRPIEGAASGGLVNVRARHYDPDTGRFLQPDPLGIAADQLYAYAANDPYRFWDPTGRTIARLSERDGGPVQTGLGRLAGGAVGLTAGAMVAPLLLANPVVAGTLLIAGGFALYQDSQNDFAGVRSYWDELGRTDLTFGRSFAGAFGVGELVGGAAGAGVIGGTAGAARGITNPIPSRLARVIPGDLKPTTLGRPGAGDVFVTAADDIAGLNPAQLAERLTIPQSRTFTVIEFDTPASGLASPVFRNTPGFVGGGRTAGGAREFVLPNGPIPADALIRRVGP